MVPHSKSALEAAREAFQPQVPELLLGRVTAVKGPPTTCVANQDLIQARFKGLYGSPIIDLKPAAAQGIPTTASSASTTTLPNTVRARRFTASSAVPRA